MTSSTGRTGLGAAASRGAVVTMAGQGVRIAIQFIGVVVLSRMLLPADFGMVAMVIAIVGVGEVFRDFGLTQAAIQARVLTQAQKSNLFWINAAIGLGLAAAVFALSWPIAMFYGISELVGLTQLLSLMFVFNGLSTQFRAHLSRELRFLPLAAVEVVGQAAGLIVAVITAAVGAGYWALVFQQVVGAGVSLVVVVAVASWLPGGFRRHVGTRSLVSFGGFLVGAQFVTYLSKNIDSIIIGARLGATDLGFYNRAFQLLVLPLNQINAPSTRVALPVLARLQDDPVQFERFLLRGQTLLLHLVIALFALAAAVAEPALGLLLGPGWEATVPLFQILAVSGAFQAASYASYWVFLAKGKTRSQLNWALVSRPLIIGGVLVGSLWGVTGVAWGYTIANAIVWPLGLLWIRRACGAPASAMFANGARTIFGYGICAGTALVAVTFWLRTENAWTDILLGAGVFLAVVLVVALSYPGFRHDLSVIPVAARALRRPR